MIHSSSRPANISGSKTTEASESVDPSFENVPFDVNVAIDSEPLSTNNEQLIHNEQTRQLAEPFVKQWNRLVSQTNWEKGRIILDWRTNLMESGVSVTAYSDEAWTRSIDGISPQHVGRLRRVFERFKDSYATYEALFWTHFLAALDWSDAELWLEGASQSRWSVSQMRRTRWEAMGNDASVPLDESEIITSEADEDFVPLAESENVAETESVAETDRELQDRIGTTGPLAEGPDFGEGESSGDFDSDAAGYEDVESQSDERLADRSSPFATLPQLPVDIAEAMEQFKLAIVRHRSTQWQDISPETVQRVLDALGSFARLGN